MENAITIIDKNNKTVLIFKDKIEIIIELERQTQIGLVSGTVIYTTMNYDAVISLL